MSLEVVQRAKADLEALGVDISGANAIRLTNLVAFRLGFGLLRKVGGTRAVLRTDGSDGAWGQDTGEPGYSVDYIIDPVTKGGYDILGDGGGANNPQWPSPEMAFVSRNTQFYATPLDPSTYMKPAAPQPSAPNDPVGVAFAQLFVARFAVIEAKLDAQHKEEMDAIASLHARLDQIVEDAKKTGTTYLPLITRIFGR